MRVLDAKQLLSSGAADSASKAARLAGISRSAFYKYRDAIFAYDIKQAGQVVTIRVELYDRPGILSGVLSEFAKTGANILTVNQSTPAQGKAEVSISASIDKAEHTVTELIQKLSECYGVKRVLHIARQQ